MSTRPLRSRAFVLITRVPGTPVVWILVSDSSLALITGKGRALKKYYLAEHFKTRRPEYVSEWIHEMMWGKSLNTLVKRAIELVEGAKKRYPEVHLNVHVCWFGNELVAEAGIAQNPNWPFDGPNGHWPDLQADCLRHLLRWFRQKCRDLGVQSAGLTTAPNSADYCIDPIFDQFYDALEAHAAGWHA